MCIRDRNDIANNSDYFNQLNLEMNDVQITRAFYNYFMGIECVNYDFTKMRPKTDFYNSMKEYNAPILVKFLGHEMNSKLLQNVQELLYKRLYEVFTSYLSNGMCKYDITEARFGIDIKEFTAITKKRSSKGIVYHIDFILLKQYLITKYKIDDVDNLELVEVEKDIAQPVCDLDTIY
jgi:hypothetical protein